MDNPKVTMSGKSELTVDGEIRFRRGASRSEFTMAYPYDSTVSEAIKRAGLPKSHRVHWSDQRKADVVRAVHDAYLEAGSDIIETNTFSATSIGQSEFFVDDPREHGGRAGRLPRSRGGRLVD